MGLHGIAKKCIVKVRDKLIMHNSCNSLCSVDFELHNFYLGQYLGVELGANTIRIVLQLTKANL